MNRKNTIHIDEHKRRIGRLRDRAEYLEARNEALSAWMGAHLDWKPDEDNLDLLHSLADALITLRRAAYPAPSAWVSDRESNHQKPGSRAPTGGDKHARHELGKLHEAVRGALGRYDSAFERDFQPPSKSEKEKLRLARRCQGTHCVGRLNRGHQQASHLDDDGYTVGQCWSRNCVGRLSSGHVVGDHESEQLPNLPDEETPGHSQDTRGETG